MLRHFLVKMMTSIKRSFFKSKKKYNVDLLLSYQRKSNIVGQMKNIELLFTGKVFDAEEKELSWEQYRENRDQYEGSWKDCEKKVVYKKDFEILDQDGVNKTVKTSGTDNKFEDEFIDQIKDYKNAV